MMVLTVADEDQEKGSEEPVGASLADLESLDLEAVLGGIEEADDWSLQQPLFQAAEEAAADGSSSAERGYRLLGIICTFHLSVDDPGQPWAPRFEGAANRTCGVSDLSGEQIKILAAFIPRIGNPALRARVADVVWYADRSQAEAGKAAIEAYCELIFGRLEGRFKARFEDLDDSIRDSVDWLHGALQINPMSGKRKAIPDAVRRAFEMLYARAEASSHYVHFATVAQLGIEYGLIGWDNVAPDAEHIAEARAAGDFPMAVQRCWDLAAQGYGRIGDDEAKRRCQARSVDETLRMRDQAPSASAKAFWTRKAIGELRAARGPKERIAKLRDELRDLQDASLDEFGHMEMPLDVADQQSRTIKVFEELSLPDLLLQFAVLTRGPTIAQLKKAAIDISKKSIFGAMFGTSHADHEGKVVAQTVAPRRDGELDDEAVKNVSLQYLDIWRHQVVGGLIEPARETAMLNFPLELRHFVPIANMSPFVPPGREHLFALGFARFFQGDFASAAHVLIPQLENSLRFVLHTTKRDSSKMNPDLLQADRSLAGLLQSLGGELETIFGADTINEIDLLFHHRPGPALRHEMAHGKISAGACYHPTIIYACWRIYRLTCAPLARAWKDMVAPAIEQASL